jgi:glycosyltransferase involved in cell wall biosynthesis
MLVSIVRTRPTTRRPSPAALGHCDYRGSIAALLRADRTAHGLGALVAIRRTTPGDRPQATGLRDWYLTNSTSFIPPPSRLPAGFEIRPIRRTPARNLANSSVSLIGFARAEFGIGEDVRLLSRALEATTIKHTITDVRTGTTIRTQDESRLGWLAPPSQGINVFCMTAFDTAERFLKCGLQAFNNNYNIGYWPWELPRFPSKWDDVYGLMDEVWTSTRFQSHAYEANGAVPVFLMPPAITPALNRMPPKLPGALRRSFCFIYVFDPNSTLARKNPRAAILAFQRAFPHSDRTVRFVLRVNGRLAGRPGARALLAAVARDRRVTISEGTLSRKDSQRFLQQADCFVSPHRAEGFGRNVAEAIAYGVPVLATAFSGTSDFLLKHERIASKPKQVRDGEYPHAEGLRWCEPDIRQLAAKMQSVRRRRPRIRQIVYLRRARLLLQHYSLQAAGRRYRQALDRINGIAGSS